jgi:hypothetical protein
MGDGYEPTSGWYEPDPTYRPPMNPDQRVADAVRQIDIQIGLLKDAIRRGGSFRIPGIKSGLVFKLSEIPEHVLTPIEQEAAD